MHINDFISEFPLASMQIQTLDEATAKTLKRNLNTSTQRVQKHIDNLANAEELAAIEKKKTDLETLLKAQGLSKSKINDLVKKAYPKKAATTSTETSKDTPGPWSFEGKDGETYTVKYKGIPKQAVKDYMEKHEGLTDNKEIRAKAKELANV